MTARIVLTITLSCIFYQAFFHLYWQSYFPPASWAVLSACIWTTCVFLRGWNTLGVWDKRQFLWGALSCLWFLNFLQTNKDFQGWGDVYFFCGHHMEYCTCDFRWNLQGWAKAAVLWNFVLSAALGMQRLAIQLGLCGLLPGEEVVTRESFISICWRLIPYWLNNWEQQWGAECSSMMFELPHFAIELLVILPCVQILCARMKILAVPHPGPLPHEAGQDVPRDNYAPNILKGQWELSPGHKKFIKRLRGNMRIMTFTVAISALAAFNALSMPLQLERQILQHPHAAATLLAGRSVAVLQTLPKMKPMRAQYVHAHRAHAMQHTPHNFTQPAAMDNTTMVSASDNISYPNSTSALNEALAQQETVSGQPATQQHYVQSRPPPGTALLPLSWLIGLFQDDCDTIFCLITGIKFVPIDGPILPPGIHSPSVGHAGAADFTTQDDSAGYTADKDPTTPADRDMDTAHGSDTEGAAPISPVLLADHDSTSPDAMLSANSSVNVSADSTQPQGGRNVSLRDSSVVSRSFSSRRSLDPVKTKPAPLPTLEEIRTNLQTYAEKLPNTSAPIDPEYMVHLLETDVNAFAAEYLNMFSRSRRRNPAPPKDLLRDAKELVIYSRLKTYAERCPSTPQLRRTLEKHSKEISKMQDPEHKILIPLVESALAVMRLSCEKFFVLITVFVAYLLFREPPPIARFIIRLNSRLSTTFQRIILYSFPAVCWIYGAGFIFSTFVSIVFWGGPVLLFYESFRNAISVVCIKSLRPSTPEEVERMGGNCAICWGEMHACPHATSTLPAVPADPSITTPATSTANPTTSPESIPLATPPVQYTTTPTSPATSPPVDVQAGSTAQLAAESGASVQEPEDMVNIPTAFESAAAALAPVPNSRDDAAAAAVDADVDADVDSAATDVDAATAEDVSEGSVPRSTSDSIADGMKVGPQVFLAAEVSDVQPKAIPSAEGSGVELQAVPTAEDSDVELQVVSSAEDMGIEAQAVPGTATGAQDETEDSAEVVHNGEDDGEEDAAAAAGTRDPVAQARDGTGDPDVGADGGTREDAMGSGEDDGNAPEASSSATEGHSLPCGHAYHHACLTQWLHQCHAQSIAPTCPMCQQSIQLEVRWRFPIPWRNPYAALAVDLDQHQGGGAGGGADDGMAGLLDHQRELQELLQDMPQIMAPEGFRDQLEVLQQQMMDDAAWPPLVPMEEEPAAREPERPVAAPVAEPAQDTDAAAERHTTGAPAHSSPNTDSISDGEERKGSHITVSDGEGCPATSLPHGLGSAGSTMAPGPSTSHPIDLSNLAPADRSITECQLDHHMEAEAGSSCSSFSHSTSRYTLSQNSSISPCGGSVAGGSSLAPVVEASNVSQVALKAVLLSKDVATPAGVGVHVSTSSDVKGG